MLDGGDRAVAAWSMASDASPSGRVGGVTVFEIAADGALAERDTLAAPAAARALVTLGE
jgi:hypothetical protein